MRLLPLLIIAYTANCGALDTAGPCRREELVLARTAETEIKTLILSDKPIEDASCNIKDMHAIWLWHDRCICIPAWCAAGLCTITDKHPLIAEINPEITAENTHFNLYAQAIEDAVVSILLWRHNHTLYPWPSWQIKNNFFLPGARVLQEVGAVLFKTAGASHSIDELITAYDSQLTTLVPDSMVWRALENFVDPEECVASPSYTTPRSFISLYKNRLTYAKNETLERKALKDLWIGICYGVEKASSLFIEWVYQKADHVYANRSTETKESLPEECYRLLQTPLFKTQLFALYYRELKKCATTALALAPRGTLRIKDAREEIWVESLTSLAKEYEEAKQYEAAAALYLFIENFSQKNFYHHLVKYGEILRYVAHKDPEAAQSFHKAIQRGYPCCSPLAEYLGKQNITVTPEDSGACCPSCCSIQ